MRVPIYIPVFIVAWWVILLVVWLYLIARLRRMTHELKERTTELNQELAKWKPRGRV